jgi:AcrR family transcriptional regulator
MSNATEKKGGRPPKALTQSTTKKAEILKAAQHIVVQHGVGQLTFDRIVKEAGVAKGTLLYHFKNKDNLLLELVKNYVEHLDEQLKLGIAAAQNSSNTVASGFAHWYRHFYATAQTNSSFGVAILSYSAQNETLRAPIREWYEKVFDMAKTAGDDVLDVLFAILAVEGLFYLQHLNLNTLTPQENEQVIKRVIKRFEKKTEAV